LNAFGKEEQIK